MAIFSGSSLNDTLSGSVLSDWIAGLAGNDTLTGNGGLDTLDGGAGMDSLVGGAGNDSYVIDSAGDKISETGGDANDRILASTGIDLTVSAVAYAGIEHVTLTGSAALNATGNGSANMLVGNIGANHVDGKGGNDTLIGGDGNDVYEVDSTSDKVIEFAHGGIDQVNSAAVSFVLGAGVENLTLTGGAVSGVGNDLGNKITGNAADNILSGIEGNDTLIGNDGDDNLNGGAGADSMMGGTGNDTYLIDDVGDKIVESGPSTDVDTVTSFATYTLGATLEALNLGGSTTIDGTGNTLSNNVFGNLGDNVLSGLAGNDQLAGLAGEDLLLGGDGNDTLFAGDGDDTLVGGAGSDVFKVFGSSPVGLDTLADLNGLPGGDKIDVVGMVGFVPGASNVNDFLKTATINGSTVIQVDKDGTANGVSFVDLAVLQGLSTDIAGLLANGVLVQGADVLEPSTKAFQGGSGADSHAGSNVVSDLMFGLAGNDTLTGDVGADTLDGGTGMDLLVGGSGSDSYVIDSVGDKISETGVDTDDRILASIGIDLTVNAAVYAGIEHVTLTGSSALNATGNGFANMLIGNSGANHLDGKVGNDTLIGGAGNDVYEVDSSDQVIELANEGIDQVNSSANFTLGANIENLTLTGASSISGQGNDLANKITGNAASNGLAGLGGNDTLIGNDGNDGLDGGTGADSMVGGAGNDTYAVDDVGDKVMENGPSTDTGDTVQSLITYTLGANLENLIQLGSATIDGTGNNLDNLLSGNSADNLLSGLAGADIIDGSLGNDLLLGGDGNDTLHASVDADTLVGGAGSDVFQFFSFSVQGVDAIADLNALGGDKIDVTSLLTGFVPGVSDVDDFLTTVTVNGSTVLEVDKDGTANGVTFFDMVVLQGVSTDIDGLLANGVLVRAGDVLAPPPTSTFQGGAGADSHAGTALSDLMFGLAGNDTLTGNAGADTLDGGAGTDSLVGGAGNDTYVVDSAGDKISETGAEANDRMLASISIDLTVNAVAYLGIEHVTLTGSAALNATGNASSNMLIGNSGANHLDGRGGPDTMIGGAGNDIYEVDDSSDQVIDELNGGIDQVNSSAIGFALGVGVENLTLTGNAAGGTGNDLANKITGNAAANFLSAGGGNDTLIAGDNADDLDGGTGADSMTGGTGTDTYHVDDIGDKVAESGPAGEFDQVRSSISYTLGANLEGLVLTGSATVDGTGNSLNNSIFGNDADNVLSGLAGDDDLFGAGGNDLLLGGDGNDVVQLGAGLDTAIGGAGNDAFQFNGGLNGLDVIADFTSGDVIDLSGLLSGFDFASDNINDFLKTSTANGNTTIQADVDGTANGVAFVDAVVLEGVSTDLAGLLTNGNLVV